MKKKKYNQIEKIHDQFIEQYFTGTKYDLFYGGSSVETLRVMQSATRKKIKDKHLDDLCLYVKLKDDHLLRELPDEYKGISVYYRVTGKVKALEKNPSDARKTLVKFLDEYFRNTDNDKYLGSYGLTKLGLTTNPPTKSDEICIVISLRKEITDLPQEYEGYKVIYRKNVVYKPRKR